MGRSLGSAECGPPALSPPPPASFRGFEHAWGPRARRSPGPAEGAPPGGGAAGLCRARACHVACSAAVPLTAGLLDRS
eukprot:7620369-Alexandrium_andersonii.AAC.1